MFLKYKQFDDQISPVGQCLFTLLNVNKNAFFWTQKRFSTVRAINTTSAHGSVTWSWPFESSKIK